jgi:hypothetical protein
VENKTIKGKLKSRRVVSNEDTFDIQTDLSNFFADNVLVHNSEIILRPYEFCVAGNTPLITRDGIGNIASFEGKAVDVWNGEKWASVNVRKTGTNQKIVRVSLSDGSYLDCTPDHRFSAKTRFQKDFRVVRAEDLVSGKYVLQLEPTSVVHEGGTAFVDAYDYGFAVGDGHTGQGNVYSVLYGRKIDLPIKGQRGPLQTKKGYTVPSQTVKTPLDIATFQSLRTLEGLRSAFTWDRASILSFIAGWMDADGGESKSGGVRLYISGEEKARLVHLLLTKAGVRSSVNLVQRSGTATNYGLRSEDLWFLQVTDGRAIPCNRLDTSRGHAPRFKAKYQTVRAVEEIEGLHDTFCFNEPERHMGLFANVLTYQCNLSEVVIRETDTLDTLKEKVRVATILGTFQSTLTNFKYINRQWAKNCEDERLLGVSLTGIFDNTLTNGKQGKDVLASALEELRKVAIATNIEWAAKLGIPTSAAITAVKPSGTVSALNGTASGIHPRHADYYYRHVRNDKKDPLTAFMQAAGVPHEVDEYDPENMLCFKFPMKSPEGAVLRDELTAIDHLELWKMYQIHWCEHKPSVTITVKEHEWVSVGAWVYENFEWMSGVSFLPHSDHTYRQSPFEDCTQAQYEALLARTPTEIDWEGLSEFESEDMTTGSQELACSAAGGGCEI